MEITWTNAAQKAAGISALAARVGTTHVRQWTEDVAEAGEREVKNTIMSGGVIATKKGGPRVKTGAMLGAVSKQVEVFGDGSGNAIAGWPDGGPMHTVFQEHGTRSKGAPSGVPPMMAIPMAQIRMSMEIPVAGTNMLANIAREWDAI